MLLSAVLILWLTSSFVEYRIIKAFPSLHKWFNGFTGMLISVGISSLVGLVVGAPAGMVVMMAAVLGLATNNLTYNTFAFLDKSGKKLNDNKHKVTDFRDAHPSFFREVIQGTKVGGMVIVGAFTGLLYTIALPFRALSWGFDTGKRMKAKYNQ
jgi:hypothetical protein